MGEAHGLQLRLRAVKGVSVDPPVPSGVATFSSAVIVGIRWKDWKTTPIFSLRNPRGRVLSIRVKVLPEGRHAAGGYAFRVHP